MLRKKNISKVIFIGLALIFCGVVVYLILPVFSKMIVASDIEYNVDHPAKVEGKINEIKSENASEVKSASVAKENADALIPVTHIKTPEKVKALYISSWVAGSAGFRDSVIKIIDTTEINAIVIDVKDSTGRVSFSTDDPEIQKIGSSENRIRNIRALTQLLHSKNIYIIGRISTFQDSYLAKLKPEWAIRKVSDGGVWKDRKGMAFLDPTSKGAQNYILSIAKVAYADGFDEINFDYIRYPSDGNLKDINYNITGGKTRADNIESFFKFISTELKKDVNIPISGDVFGLTTEVKDDMGIGQVWEKAVIYFDFLCPMVYPSHYPPGHAGYKNPALYPYEVINRALIGAVAKTKASGQSILKIRPWLQDFDMGATYTKEMVRAQIKATYDNGLTSWMLWDPANKYTPSALLPEKNN